jgi:mannitol/fructose-specific phosphotransferase system IIA component (Ntr-type)
VEMIFLIANAQASEQVKVIQALVNCFSDGQTLLKIRSSTTHDEIVEILKESAIN